MSGRSRRSHLVDDRHPEMELRSDAHANASLARRVVLRNHPEGVVFCYDTTGRGREADGATGDVQCGNLFARAKALRATSLGEANPVLEAFQRFTTVSSRFLYDPADKSAMLADLETL